MAKYHMHKTEREITDPEILRDVLARGKYVIISMCRNGEPYVVTLSHGYDREKEALYFHCALKGLKIDFIEENPRVCATVIEDLGYQFGECEHHYRTVVFWGNMFVINDLDEKKYGLDILLNHLEDDPDSFKKRLLKDDDAYRKVGVLRLDIGEMTGKLAEK